MKTPTEQYAVFVDDKIFVCSEVEGSVDVFYGEQKPYIYVGEMTGEAFPPNNEQESLYFERRVIDWVKQRVEFPVVITTTTRINRIILPEDLKNDYTDDQSYTHIDLYEGEEGRTIAIVCRDTRKVYYIDHTLRGNETVQAKIKEVIDQLLKEHSVLTYNLINHDLKIAGEYLSGDEDVRDQVIAILEHCDQAEENEDDFIDDVDGVCVWQKVQYEFTCRQFLRLIQI